MLPIKSLKEKSNSRIKGEEWRQIEDGMEPENAL
jgi:hypothetical protein